MLKISFHKLIILFGQGSGLLLRISEIIGDQWRSLEIIGDHWRSLEIIGDHWRSLEIIGDHWSKKLENSVVDSYLRK